MWNSYPNNEVAGYVTSDGKLILTNVTGNSGGEVFGTFLYNGTYYYPYPKSQGSPTLNYNGMLEIGPLTNRYYLIPVVASIHTHTPCRTDGTDGITNFEVSLQDRTFASKASGLNHWVIGCGAIGQFNSVNNYYFNISTGNLSFLCNQIE